MFENPTEELKDRVKLALAIAIIRSKPAGVTAKEVAVSLQKKLETEQSTIWTRQTDLNVKQRIYKLKHELLHSALPTESTNVSDFSLGGDFAGKDIPDGAGEDATEEAEFHLMFIQSMVQLKSALSTCTFLRASVLKTIINSMTNDVFYPEWSVGAEQTTAGDLESVYSLNTTHSVPAMTEDSGYCSSEIGKENDRKIPSSLLKYILCDSDANDLIVKSVEALLSYMEKSLSGDDEKLLEQTVKDWRNSLLEDAVNVLTDTVNILTQYDQSSGQCRSACLKFITNQIHKILTPSKISKYTTCECRCLIVCEMCNSLYLCADTIEFLLDKVIVFSSKTGAACETELDKDFIDGVFVREADLNFYVFHLLETLIVKYQTLVKIMKQSSSKFKEKPKPATQNILELWRDKFCNKAATETTNCEKEEEHLSRMNVWRSSLEQCLIKFSESNPKFTFAVWTSFEKLKETIQMETDDG